MIVYKCLGNNLIKKCFQTVCQVQKTQIHNRSRIGNRDWVGFGRTGCASYSDDPLYPCPAIRFKENTNELLALKEKEKGDWRKLTIDEKKELYRASFRQTLVEVLAPTGEWKSVIGLTLIIISLGLWSFIFMKLFLYGPRPKTFSDEWREMTLRKMIDTKAQHLRGVSSKWDYELDDWKK